MRPRNSRHCFICDKCVDRQDHHCQWINQCVGIGNHNSFFVFVILVWAYLLHLLGTCIAHLHPSSRPLVQSDWHTGMLLFLILFILLFLVPLTLLLILQSLNFLHGQTTGARLKMATMK